MSEVLAAIAKIVVIVWTSIFGLGEAPEQPEQTDAQERPAAVFWQR